MLPSIYLLSVRDLRFDCLAPRPSLYLLSIHDLRFDCLAPRASLRLFLIRDLRSATFASLASSCRELRRSKIRPSSRPGPGRWAVPRPRTRTCPRHAGRNQSRGRVWAGRERRRRREVVRHSGLWPRGGRRPCYRLDGCVARLAPAVLFTPGTIRSPIGFLPFLEGPSGRAVSTGLTVRFTRPLRYSNLNALLIFRGSISGPAMADASATVRGPPV